MQFTLVIPTPKESDIVSTNLRDEEQIGKTQGRTFTIVNGKKPMHEMVTRKYQVNIADHITDLFQLSLEERLEILQAVNDQYKVIEDSDHPAAGYKVHFEVIAKGEKPVEVILEACGERKVGSKMEMPMPKVQDEESCAFCKNTKVMLGYEDATTDSAHVIPSLKGNPLAITNKHAKHFFDMSIEGQKDMLTTAIKVAEIYTQKKCSRFTLSSHIGIQGHQTFPHAHIHALGSFFRSI